MIRLYLLVDYKGRFGTKWAANPYRSGLDLSRLSRSLEERGIEPHFVRVSDVSFRPKEWQGRLVLYTSSEDADLHYKGFIEDILLGLQLQGAILIPRFEFFRAHHNKVFMEILRQIQGTEDMNSVRSRYFGTLEEVAAADLEFREPRVIKPAAGSLSTGVALVRSRAELLKRATSISRNREPLRTLKDKVRTLRHKDYIRDSTHRRKFVVQDFIAGLGSDWKVLIYGRKYYPLRRQVRPGDFRASGSGLFEWPADVPDQLLEFAEAVFTKLDVPFLSLDIGMREGKPLLFEFQGVHFGTRTLDGSMHYFQRSGSRWELRGGTSVLEDEFAASVAAYAATLAATAR